MNERALMDQLQALVRKPNHSKPEKEELDRVQRKLHELQNAKLLLRNQYGNWGAETPQLLRENSKFRDILSEVVLDNTRQRKLLAKLRDRLTQNDFSRNTLPFSQLTAMRVKQTLHVTGLKGVQQRYGIEKTSMESLTFTAHRLAADLTILRKNINRLIYYLLKLTNNESKISGSKIIYHFKQMLAQVLLGIHVNKYQKALGHQFARNSTKREHLDFQKKESALYEERAANLLIKVSKLEQQNAELKAEVAALSTLPSEPPRDAGSVLSREWNHIKRTAQGILCVSPQTALDTLLRILDHPTWNGRPSIQQARNTIFQYLTESIPNYKPSTCAIAIRQTSAVDQPISSEHVVSSADFDGATFSEASSTRPPNSLNQSKRGLQKSTFNRYDHQCMKKPMTFVQSFGLRARNGSSNCSQQLNTLPVDSHLCQSGASYNRGQLPNKRRSKCPTASCDPELEVLLQLVVGLPLQVLENLILLTFEDINQKLDKSQTLYNLMSVRYFQNLRKLDSQRTKADMSTQLILGSGLRATQQPSVSHTTVAGGDASPFLVNTSLEFLIDIRFHLLLFINRIENCLREINRVCISLSCTELIFNPQGTSHHIDFDLSRWSGTLDVAMRFVGGLCRKAESDPTDDIHLATIERVVGWIDRRLPFLSFPLTEIDRKNREIIWAEIPLNDVQAVFRFDFYRCVIADWPRLSSVLQMLCSRLSGATLTPDSTDRVFLQLPSISVDTTKKMSVLHAPLKRAASKKTFLGSSNSEVSSTAAQTQHPPLAPRLESQLL